MYPAALTKAYLDTACKGIPPPEAVDAVEQFCRFVRESPLGSVTAPAEEEIDRERVVSRFADREEERADAKRTFRVLHQGELTQFIGIVEPCRAPDHSHPYEVGYIVEGNGIAHIGGVEVPLHAGSCFYLRPGCVHCIENTGPGVMRIMGVFHPAGSPRQRSYDAARD